MTKIVIKGRNISKDIKQAKEHYIKSARMYWWADNFFTKWTPLPILLSNYLDIKEEWYELPQTLEDYYGVHNLLELF